MDLPLRDNAADSFSERAAAFYRVLRTQLFGRFLGLRRASRAPG